jgi:GcrA cell cycle regulator
MSERLGIAFTRNAVVGLRKRVGLPPRRTGAAAGYTVSKRTKPRRPGPIALNAGVGFATLHASAPPPPDLSLPIADTDIPESQRCTILEVSDSKCRWPVGNPGNAGFFFCGGKPSERPFGKEGREPCPYCDRHADIAFAGRPRPKAQAA